MALLYLSLGANLGPREETLERAISDIENRIGHVFVRSGFFETAPWGFSSKNAFLNACIGVETECSPGQCLRLTQQIERTLGRTHKSDGHYSDRVIDIDLLFYDHLVLDEKDLQLPHPLLHQRRFVLEPLCQIAPALRHPVLGKTMTELLADLTEDRERQILLQNHQQEDAQQQSPDGQTPYDR